MIGAPKQIFVCEDASGIISKVTYDSVTNQLIGVLLPLNTNNGMPKILSFKAESAEQISEIMKLPRSSLVYIVVAQPLVRNATPYILQAFGTNNTFRTQDVLNRWKHTLAELQK